MTRDVEFYYEVIVLVGQDLDMMPSLPLAHLKQTCLW